MKSGTSHPVLISELLAGDGPYESVADDFVHGRCSRCGREAGDDSFFVTAGFVCGVCARFVGDEG